MDSLPRPVLARVKSLGSRNLWHVHPWAQFTYANKGVLVVRTDQGTFPTPPQWAVWIPAGVYHEVITSVRTERRNFFIDPRKVYWSLTTCRVLEVSLRELIGVVAALPVEYDGIPPSISGKRAKCGLVT